MKKLLLLVASALSAVASMAQSSMATAAELVIGADSAVVSATVASGEKGWWTYTPAEDVLLTLKSESSEVNVTTDGDADWKTIYINTSKAYPVHAGQKVYITAKGETEVGFTATAEPANIGGLEEATRCQCQWTNGTS